MEQQSIKLGDRVIGADDLGKELGRHVPDYIIHRYYGSRDEYLAEHAATLNAWCDDLVSAPEDHRGKLRFAIAQRCADLLVNGLDKEIARAALRHIEQR